MDEQICKEQQVAEGKMHRSLRNLDTSNIIHLRAEWELDPSSRFINGSVTWYFTPDLFTDGQIFDLSDSLVLDSIIFHSQSIGFNHHDNQFLIPPQLISWTPIVFHILDSIQFYYHGVPPSNGLGSFEQTDHNGSPIIWTLSEPYGASDWFPCKNSLTDKIDSMDVFLTVPNGNIGVSNGTLIDTTQTGSQTTYHWKNHHPIATYLVCLAVTNYECVKDSVNTVAGMVRLENYFYPEDAGFDSSGALMVKEPMMIYDSLFGAYPFIDEKYAQVHFGWGGGMEHQTSTFVGNFTNYELLAHELAHQWFGDKVTCGSWADIWLNEGFATYLDGICLQHSQGGYWWMPWKQYASFVALGGLGGTVYCDDTTDVSCIFSKQLSYYKAAYVLHMLRWELGDSAFFAGCWNYLNDPALAYGFARTADLQHHLETASGKNLAEFFSEWIYGGGYLHYRANWYQYPLGGELVLSLWQFPQYTFNLFNLDVPVQLIGDSRDTTVIIHNNAFRNDVAFFPGFEVKDIQVDPELWILHDSSEVFHYPKEIGLFSSSFFPNPVRQGGELISIVPINEIWNILGQPVAVPEKEQGTGFLLKYPINLPAGVYFVDGQMLVVVE